MKKLISIVAPTYNEEANIRELYQRVSAVMTALPYDYEMIIIDNHSTDRTVEFVKEIAASDKRVKLIVNARNFGHIRSPYYGLLQASGDACVLIASDLQDPPEMIPALIAQWETGFKTVLATKSASDESMLMRLIRRSYYRLVKRISEVPLISDATGAGLFDKAVIEILRRLDDPYPYFRGLVCEIGFPIATVPFAQPKRARGVTKNNFYTLYDIAMLGITKHSKVPLRLMTMFGFALAFLSITAALLYTIAKLLFWDYFALGIAPMLIATLFFGGLQMLLVGLLGEYVGMIHTQVRNLPLVVELERVNFEPARGAEPDSTNAPATTTTADSRA